MKQYTVTLSASFEAENDAEARAQTLSLSVVMEDSGNIADSDIVSLTTQDETEKGDELRVLYQEGGPFAETIGYLIKRN